MWLNQTLTVSCIFLSIYIFSSCWINTRFVFLCARRLSVLCFAGIQQLAGCLGVIRKEGFVLPTLQTLWHGVCGCSWHNKNFAVWWVPQKHHSTTLTHALCKEAAEKTVSTFSWYVPEQRTDTVWRIRHSWEKSGSWAHCTGICLKVIFLQLRKRVAWLPPPWGVKCRLVKSGLLTLIF